MLQGPRSQCHPPSLLVAPSRPGGSSRAPRWVSHSFITLRSPGPTPDRSSPLAPAGPPSPWGTSPDVSLMPEATSAAHAGLQQPHPPPPARCTPEPPGASAQPGAGEGPAAPRRGDRDRPGAFPPGKPKPRGPGQGQEPSPAPALLLQGGSGTVGWGAHAHGHRGASMPAGPAAGRLLQKRMGGGRWMSPRELGGREGKRERGHPSPTSPLGPAAAPRHGRARAAAPTRPSTHTEPAGRQLPVRGRAGAPLSRPLRPGDAQSGPPRAPGRGQQDAASPPPSVSGMGSSGARSREGSGEAEPFLPMPQDCPALWICQRLSSASALACLRRSAWPCAGRGTASGPGGDGAWAAPRPLPRRAPLNWPVPSPAPGAHPPGAAGEGRERRGGGGAALAPHLQDGDVPGEALQRLLQLAAPQPLLGLDAGQLLVEVHPCAGGSGAQRARGHGDGHRPPGEGDTAGGTPCARHGGVRAGWAPGSPDTPPPVPGTTGRGTPRSPRTTLGPSPRWAQTWPPRGGLRAGAVSPSPPSPPPPRRAPRDVLVSGCYIYPS